MAQSGMSLFLQRNSFSSTTGILDGCSKDGEKLLGKNLSAILAEIIHQSTKQVTLGQENLREIQGGIRDRERKLESVRGRRIRERERKEILIQATVQGMISAPRR